MIDITNKQDCVGCNACTQRCPTSCISMQEDDEGFLYPCVDQSMCIHCGLCEKVCPVIHQALPGEPINTFAAKNMNDSIRRKSSSGGVFHALACNVINEGGVVFGARFDSKWGVEHSYTETISGLAFSKVQNMCRATLEQHIPMPSDFSKPDAKCCSRVRHANLQGSDCSCAKTMETFYYR